MPRYEAWFRDTDAAHARFSRALTTTRGAEFHTALNTGASVTVIVTLPPERVADFAARAKLPDPPRYKSPTVFSHGTLVPMYASAEDEVAGTMTPSAARVVAAQETEGRR